MGTLIQCSLFNVGTVHIEPGEYSAVWTTATVIIFLIIIITIVVVLAVVIISIINILWMYESRGLYRFEIRYHKMMMRVPLHDLLLSSSWMRTDSSNAWRFAPVNVWACWCIILRYNVWRFDALFKLNYCSSRQSCKHVLFVLWLHFSCPFHFSVRTYQGFSEIVEGVLTHIEENALDACALFMEFLVQGICTFSCIA